MKTAQSPDERACGLILVLALVILLALLWRMSREAGGLRELSESFAPKPPATSDPVAR